MFDWPNIFDHKGLTPLSIPLASFAFLYGLGIRFRLLAHQTCIRSRSLPGAVVSIGNLTAGGTGKTPATRMLAEWAAQRNYRVAILSRGYAGHYKTKIFEVSDGNTVHAGPDEAGDEAYLLAKRLPGIPVIVSKDRYLAGQHAYNRFKTNVFILDDGFQHIALQRDFDLVLIDAANPFGNGHLLPWGPLREPLSQLKRAHATIITRSSQAKAVEDDVSKMIKKRFPDMPLFKGDHIPEQVVFPGRGTSHDIGILKGKRVLAFAGIARPELFRESIIQLGAEVLVLKKYRDHHPFTGNDFRQLLAQKETLRADCLLTTEKDWVRLEHIAKTYNDLAYLTIRFGFLSEEDRFFEIIKKRLTSNE